MDDYRTIESIRWALLKTGEPGKPPILRDPETFLGALREIGYDVYRPGDCRRGTIDTVIYDDGPDDGLLYFKHDSRGAYRLVPVEPADGENPQAPQGD